MQRIILVAAIAALAACSKPAGSTINETSWEYIEDGKPMQESIDAKGNYIKTSGAEHIDHGTVVMKEGKACFTSAMTKQGEVCWTSPKLDVGASGETVSDTGEKLPIKRIPYVAKTM